MRCAVRRDQDQAAAGRRLAFARRRVELDAGGAQIVAVDGAELVVGDLADEGGAGAEAGEAGERVGRRRRR